MEKKNTKKIIIIVSIVIVLIAAIVGIGYFVMLKVEEGKAKASVEEMFTTLKSAENSEQKQKILSGIKSDTQGVDDKLDYTILFEKLSYNIVKGTANFNEAEIILEVTNKDMKTVLQRYINKALQVALTNAFTHTYTDEQVNEQLLKYLKEQIESDEIETIKTEITLKMEKKDGNWVVKEANQEDFVNAVLPGLVDAIKEMANSFNSFGQQ